MSPALYLIDTSGLFRILQGQHREVWMDQMTAGVIATCPLVEFEFLYPQPGRGPTGPRSAARSRRCSARFP